MTRPRRPVGDVAGILPSGLRLRAYGSGDPVTLVVPGLGATPGEARIPASGLPGTRVVLTLPSHGDAADAPADYWRYPTIAEDVLAAADRVGATRAVGVSLGAGALTTLVAEHPARFERLALVLPAALDAPRDPAGVAELGRLRDAALAGDRELLRKLVAAGLPEGPGLGDYAEARTAALLRLAPALDELAGPRVPVPDRAALARVDVPVLVLAATGDPLHPAAAAGATAEAFPRARLERFDSAHPLITHRAEVRALLMAFLGGDNLSA